MSFLQSILFTVSFYTLCWCLMNLTSHTTQANSWYATFRDIAKTLRASGGQVDTQQFADEIQKLAWKILEDDRSRTFWGRRWLKKYKTDKLFEEADRIVGGVTKK